MEEGGTKLVAAPGTPRGPEARSADSAFFNPAMRLNRDLSMMLVDAYARGRGRPIDVADVLAGTGARSLRLARLDADLTVHANDADPKAVQAMHEGREANAIDPDRLHIHHDDAHRFLASQRFDVIDVDPFGSPTPFLDAAVRATRHNGLLCITATDTAALSGTYPRVCRRRYGAEHRLKSAPWSAELGLRILAGTAMRAAGRFDRAAWPVLSVWGGHWMRVILRIQDGKQAADRCGKSLGHVSMGDGGQAIWGTGSGPAWTGPLHDAETLATWQHVAGVDDASWRMASVMQAEASAPAFWFELGALRRHFNVDAPKREVLMQRLRDAGYVAAPTHMDPQGIRTDADLEAIRAVW